MLYLEARIAGKPVRWPVREGDHIVGRDETCALYVDDQSISRRHLRLVIQHGTATVEDLGSTNGLFVDGERVDQATLRFDQWFVAGNVLMSIREGLSLTSDSSTGRGGRPVGSGGTTDIPRAEPQAVDWLGSLGRALAGLESIDAILLETLCCVAQGYRAFGAAFVGPSGSGWIAHALWGSPIPESVDLQLGDLDAARSIVLDSNDGTVLCHPVRRGSGLGGWLLFHPWDRRLDSGAELDLLVGWCRCWLELHTGEHSAEQAAAGTSPAAPPPGFVAAAEASRRLLAEADQIAATHLNVLLQGETGVGKEVLARRVHDQSPFAEGPFVAINCSAIPRELLEAELFGIERGTATGVEGRPGRFVLASGGTLFLDEVGELPTEIQPKLLRALECGEVLPLGAPAAVPVKVRVVSATLRDIDADVADGRFRADLRYRLEGAVLRIAPLRERPEDILPLARLFARKAADDQGQRTKGLDLEAARILLGYDWPGNVRELRNVIFRAVALATDTVIHADLFPPRVRHQADLDKGGALLGLRGDWRKAKATFEYLYFSQLLDRAAGSVPEAARLSGMNRTNLYRKLDELGLRKPAKS